MGLRNILLVGVGLLVGLGLVIGTDLSRPYMLRGSVLEPATAAPAINLVDVKGEPFRLSEQAGKLSLVFFGYTSCPDVCPATLSEMKQVRRALDDKASQVNFVYITVDPERDTVEKIRAYLEAFDPAFIGITGTEAELLPVWQGYGVYRAVNEETRTAAGYLVDHSARVYLIDKQGNLRLTYAFGTPVDDITADVRYLIRE